VANMLIGIVGATFVVRVLVNWRVVLPDRAGFRGIGHALIRI
jgi:ABC-type uncharacterized transport system permease subunit